jgi:hypothetical protein
MNWTQEQNKGDIKEYEYHSSFSHLHESVMSKYPRVWSHNDVGKGITI